jgi:hypothetical protein
MLESFAPMIAAVTKFLETLRKMLETSVDDISNFGGSLTLYLARSRPTYS